MIYFHGENHSSTMDIHTTSGDVEFASDVLDMTPQTAVLRWDQWEHVQKGGSHFAIHRGATVYLDQGGVDSLIQVLTVLRDKFKQPEGG